MAAALRVLSALLLLGLLPPPGSAEGSWLVDEARWHASGHGRMLCSDCHAEIARLPRHPDPGNFAGGAFDPGRCAACHAEVLEELKAERHAGKTLAAGVDYGRCVACHDPHAPAAGALEAPVSCGRCHEERKGLPELPPAEEACLACHRLRDPLSPQAARDARRLCLPCHGEGATEGGSEAFAAAPRLESEETSFRPHAGVSCLACHREAARYAHAGQHRVDCLACHVRHNETVAHDAHLAVSCAACHRKGIEPRRDPATGKITAARPPGAAAITHDMTAASAVDGCRRCHHPNNALGAAAAALPPKGVLCIPCHPGTLTAADPVTPVALLLFGLGIAASLFFWFGAAGGGAGSSALRAGDPAGGARIPRKRHALRPGVERFVLDGMLQRRLYRRVRGRWLIHTLIAWPIGLRCLWGLAALAGSLWAPQSAWPWALLDRHAPASALFFELTGLTLLAGTGAALLRRLLDGGKGLPGLPGGAWAGSALLAAIAAAGFLLEGMRIAMSGHPPGAAFAFVGDGLARIFHGRPGLDELYAPAWYLHAVLTGIFAAWIPFGPMFHILLAPVLLALGSGEDGVLPPERRTPPAAGSVRPGNRSGEGGDHGDRRLSHAR